MNTEKPFDLTDHNLKNPELITRIYAQLLKSHSGVGPEFYQTIVEYEAVKRDMRYMDIFVQELRDRGESDEEIIKKVYDRAYGRNTN